MARLEQKSAGPGQDSGEKLWTRLSRDIDQGRVIPFISASLIYGQVFGELFSDGVPGSIMQDLAGAWADRVNYVGPDRQRLGRVAQYVRTRAPDLVDANQGYLDFLKDLLLDAGSQDEHSAEVADELRADRDRWDLARIARELGYPKSEREDEDPLNLLARLPLTLYITTGYHDFVEQALMSQARKPRTRICFWNGQPYYVADEHRSDRSFEPTPEEPLVYHLYGYEPYPESLVLSDDDYFAFLVKLSQDVDPSAPLIPLDVSEAIIQSSLLLLGYQVQDWDFRVLLRGLINQRPSSLRRFSLAVLSDASPAFSEASREAARSHVEKYLDAAGFQVYWGTPEAQMHDLWQSWRA